MVKNSRRQTTDFAKAKAKLGKGKQRASNAVDTSFKARSIVIPRQTITSLKDESIPGKPSLSEILTHLNHYNPGTKRDALNDLQQLLTDRQSLLTTSLPSILQSCARLVGDEDFSVRKANCTLLQTILPRVPPALLKVHVHLLLLYIASAQSHIFPEIRVDATKVLDIVLDCVPALVVAGWDENVVYDSLKPGIKFLRCYMSILGVSIDLDRPSDNPTVIEPFSLSTTSKVAVMSSLAKFLQHALHRSVEEETATRPSLPTWYFKSAFLTEEAFKMFSKLLEPPLDSEYAFHASHPEADSQTLHLDCPEPYRLLTSDRPLWSLNDSHHPSEGYLPIDNGGVTAHSSWRAVYSLAKALQPLLISTILDVVTENSATNLSRPREVDLTLIGHSLKLAYYLYEFLLRNSRQPLREVNETCGLLEAFLEHISKIFPLESNGNRSDTAVSSNVLTLNLVYCELVAIWLLASSSPASASEKRLNSSISEFRISSIMGYVITVLQTEQLDTAIDSYATYRALMPTVWTLLHTQSAENQEGKLRQQELMSGLIEHDRSLRPNSFLKKLSTEFIARLILIDSDRFRRQRVDSLWHEGSQQILTEWFLRLPQIIWELGNKNLDATGMLLLSLLRIIGRLPSWLSKQSVVEVRSRYCQFFITKHPKQGLIPGPYKKLPPFRQDSIRRLALDLVSALIDSVGSTWEHNGELERAAILATADVPDAKYLTCRSAQYAV